MGGILGSVSTIILADYTVSLPWFLNPFKDLGSFFINKVIRLTRSHAVAKMSRFRSVVVDIIVRFDGLERELLR